MKEFTLSSSSQSNEQESEPTISDVAILKGLNEQQREAVSVTDGPLQIVAGAGSGKTRVLTFRIAYLLQQKKAWPNQILALTFTNKAASEMRERIKQMAGPSAEKIWMGTFHSIFARILRYEAKHLGYNSRFSIYDSDDSKRAIKLILQELNFDIKQIKPRTIQNKISSAKNELIDPDTFKAKFISSSIDDIVAAVYPIYLQRLKQSNAMDFDDLLIKPIELFEKNKEIREKYQDRFKYILIDEYQDTNHAQYVVTQLLAQKHKNICVVGDDAQSIYSFRGADISNILDFQNDYPKANRIPLEQNYRSTKNILRAADSIIKQNEKQLEKSLWTDNHDGEPITLLENLNERDEANRVARHIGMLRMNKGYRPSDIAILYRTNYQSRVFEDALRRKNVNYQLVGGVSFYQRKEVKDVLAYLKMMVNPQDEESLLRIINEPARGVGAKSLQTIIQESRRHERPVWETLQQIQNVDLYKPAKSAIADFVHIIKAAQEKLEEGDLKEAADFILNKTSYLTQLVEENTHESLGRRDNVLELLNAIKYFEKEHDDATLTDFLQEVSLVSDLDKMEAGKPAVTLMSIHASKGLEFPVVFITGLEEGLFPMKRQDDDVDIEEERRLFYVAITRAEKELFLSHAKSRYKFGEEKRMIISRFLDEIDPNVVRTETGASINQRKGGFGRDKSDNPFRDAFSDELKPENRSRWKKPGSSSSSSRSVEYDDQSVTAGDFQVGVKVFHEKFGKGKIIAKEGGQEKTKVTVFFQQAGQKKLLLRFAKLRIVS
jgi:DNA helicase-2/ATP-dependent DNA helicase PcrA